MHNHFCPFCSKEFHCRKGAFCYDDKDLSCTECSAKHLLVFLIAGGIALVLTGLLIGFITKVI